MAEEAPITIKTEACRSCGAAIYWALTELARRPIPMDSEPVANGNKVLTLRKGDLVAERFDPEKHAGRRRFASHFSSCPNGAEWRRP